MDHLIFLPKTACKGLDYLNEASRCRPTRTIDAHCVRPPRYALIGAFRAAKRGLIRRANVVSRRRMRLRASWGAKRPRCLRQHLPRLCVN